jgi:hypothetical protein
VQLVRRGVNRAVDAGIDVACSFLARIVVLRVIHNVHIAAAVVDCLKAFSAHRAH